MVIEANQQDRPRDCMRTGSLAAHNQSGQGSAAAGGKEHFWDSVGGKAAVNKLLSQLERLQPVQEPGETTRIGELVWWVLHLKRSTRIRLLNLNEENLLGLFSNADTYINSKVRKRLKKKKREPPTDPACLWHHIPCCGLHLVASSSLPRCTSPRCTVVCCA